jgi:hypothetical protein
MSMSSYLIEVIQPADDVSRRRVGLAASMLGSHFVARASWRESGDRHIGSMVVDCDQRADALALVPPCLRSFARVTRLERARAA